MAQQITQTNDKVYALIAEEANASLELDAVRAWSKSAEYKSTGLGWVRICINNAICEKFKGFNVNEFLELVTILKEQLTPPCEMNRGRPEKKNRHNCYTIASSAQLVQVWLGFCISGCCLLHQWSICSSACGSSRGILHSHSCNLYIVELSHKQQGERVYLHPNYPQAAVMLDCSDQSINVPHKKVTTHSHSSRLLLIQTQPCRQSYN